MKTRNLLVAAACAALCGCSESPVRQAFVRSVCLARPAVQGEIIEKSFSGVVKEAHEISLGFRTGGQIERLLAGEGDFVRKGQLLAVLDGADYRLDVEGLQAQYNQMKDEVARTRRLYEEKSVSANEYEKAVASLRQLETQLQTSRNKLDYTRLHAPVDCYVQSVNYSVAEMVNAGSSVFELLDVSRMEVEVDIPSGIYMARGSFTGFGGHTSFSDGEIPLRLLSITPKADGNQLYRMKLTPEGGTCRQLTAGMNMDVRVRMAAREQGGTVTIPLHAVLREEGGDLRVGDEGRLHGAEVPRRARQHGLRGRRHGQGGSGR